MYYSKECIYNNKQTGMQAQPKVSKEVCMVSFLCATELYLLKVIKYSYAFKN